jgi:hypothetical protein
MAEDFAVLYRSADRDGDGSKLRGVLEAHLRMEHARGIRELAVGVLAVLGLPVWIAAARPEWIAQGLRSFSLTAWFVSFVGLAAAAISEWRWRRELDRLVARQRNS